MLRYKTNDAKQKQMPAGRLGVVEPSHLLPTSTVVGASSSRLCLAAVMALEGRALDGRLEG